MYMRHAIPASRIYSKTKISVSVMTNDTCIM
jgi:hypothetical protein